MKTLLAVSYSSPDLKEKAKSIATDLGLPLVEKGITSCLFTLVVTSDRLELHYHGKEKQNPIVVDFTHGKLAHRYQYGGGRGQLIARAVGIKSTFNPEVLDLTAGLGTDGFILATLGCKVTMIERSPLIAALVQDGINRARQEAWFSTLQLTLLNMDAIKYLQELAHKPDVIYLDPMFPDTKKTALVKKEMRTLRLIVGEDEDAPTLFNISLTHAKRRIVVKRPLYAPTLTELQPDLVYKGQSTRFDVYFPSA